MLVFRFPSKCCGLGDQGRLCGDQHDPRWNWHFSMRRWFHAQWAPWQHNLFPSWNLIPI